MTQPAINVVNGADPRIVAELEQVRERAALGTLPALRRGRMIFDFGKNKVRVAKIGSAA